MHYIPNANAGGERASNLPPVRDSASSAKPPKTEYGHSLSPAPGRNRLCPTGGSALCGLPRASFRSKPRSDRWHPAHIASRWADAGSAALSQAKLHSGKNRSATWPPFLSTFPFLEPPLETWPRVLSSAPCAASYRDVGRGPRAIGGVNNISCYTISEKSHWLPHAFRSHYCRRKLLTSA